MNKLMNCVEYWPILSLATSPLLKNLLLHLSNTVMLRSSNASATYLIRCLIYNQPCNHFFFILFLFNQ